MLTGFDIPINFDGSISLITCALIVLIAFLIAWATYEILVYSEKRRRDKIIARSEIERTEYFKRRGL